MGHSIIPPSSAHIWGSPNGCHAWALMAVQYPESDDNEAAKEGTAAHEIAERLIQAATRANTGRPKREEVSGTLATNGVVFSDEMFDAAEMFAENCTAIMRAEGVFGGDGLMIERHVKAPQVHEVSEGTLDFGLFSERTMTLYVSDFKFGFEIVSEYENWQLINYVAGILAELEAKGVRDSHITVVFRIVQPRAHHHDGPIREWKVNAAELRPFINQLHLGAHLSLRGDGQANTGPHCKHCSARHACPAALQAGARLYEVSCAPTPIDLSPQALGTQLAIVKRARKHLQALESGFEEQAKALVRGGANVVGWMAQEKRGRQKWSRPAHEVAQMGDMMKLDLRKPVEAITPKQALDRGLNPDLVAAYSEIPRNGYELVPDDGKAKRIFSQ